MNQEEFAEKIKRIRKDNNMTQADFAKSLGVTFQAVSKWENGKNMPDIAIIRMICEKYHIDINDLVGTGYKEKKKNFLQIGLILLLILFIIIVFIFYMLHDDTFEFKTISSGCSAFKISGSIAYNNYRTALHITNIDYCDGEDDEKYTKIECSLYLIDDSKKTETILNSVERYSITLEDFLEDVSFDIDSKYNDCKSFKDSNLELKINAYDKDSKITNYNIPLTFNTCN